MSKSDTFNPGVTGSAEDGLFGIPTNEKNSLVHILPVPWEVTTSYGRGTALGPKAILEASPQIDLYDLEFKKAYEKGFHLFPLSEKWLRLNNKLKAQALKIRDQIERKGKLSKSLGARQQEINANSEKLNSWVYDFAMKAFSKEKIPAVLGGDHSSPEGLILASSEAHGEIGVLHIDAHADLREAYQGFTHSHASIMFNVMSHKSRPKKLVQVGIRDFCEEEFEQIQSRSDITCHFDQNLKNSIFSGESWKSLCEKIISELPAKVHISFDIDGLDPVLCPGTGTPVPGGLQFSEANLLIKTLVASGRQIVSFDLNEVAPSKNSEWDANVGARVLFKLCGWSALSMENKKGENHLA
ncbi:MAG: agmatinase family protein [Bdellovibrionales bacterium]|nr:agmatinase family protein [Bdellovibrionales bacterium]